MKSSFALTAVLAFVAGLAAMYAASGLLLESVPETAPNPVEIDGRSEVVRSEPIDEVTARRFERDEELETLGSSLFGYSRVFAYRFQGGIVGVTLYGENSDDAGQTLFEDDAILTSFKNPSECNGIVMVLINDQSEAIMACWVDRIEISLGDDETPSGFEWSLRSRPVKIQIGDAFEWQGMNVVFKEGELGSEKALARITFHWVGDQR